jgi:hypothetical protein
MSFFKETDYHGSRTYDVDPAAYLFLDHLRLRLSLTIAWARLKIGKLICRAVDAPQSSSLMYRGEKHFTLLGNRQRALPARPPISEIFSSSDLIDRQRKRVNQD